MKKFAFIFIILFVGVFMTGCVSNNNESVIRIHIRANSNSESDQSIKLVVRDAVVEYITPLISECSDSKDVKVILANNLTSIQSIANNVLVENGYTYKSSVNIRNEYFPSRDYGGNTFPADYYDALILELGKGIGDNWWCVAYPPLCFIGEYTGNNSVKYKSKILELINKYLG